MVNFEFILRETETYKDTFIFYPNSSHLHVFDDIKPVHVTDYKKAQIYTVYYAWEIEHIDYCNNELKLLVSFYPDEGSCLIYLVDAIEDVINNHRKTEVLSSGQPASFWTIEYLSEDRLQFTVFDNWTNQGYKFILPVDRCYEFCKFINNINQYMLEHCESI